MYVNMYMYMYMCVSIYIYILRIRASRYPGATHIYTYVYAYILYIYMYIENWESRYRPRGGRGAEARESARETLQSPRGSSVTSGAVVVLAGALLCSQELVIVSYIVRILPPANVFRE
jgi:hypothetical protein